jgi:hypothetical protein
VEIVGASANAPVDAVSGVAFVLTAGATLRNNGPVSPVIVDTTFTPVLPASCSATSGVKTVSDTTLSTGTTVFVSRSWMVTCNEAGPQSFTMNVSLTIDPPYVDTNPANNAGSASGSTTVS